MRLAATRLGAISQGRGLGNLLWDLAGAVPSLDQRFAEDKSLVDAISGQQLITFSRASDATFVGSNGLIQTASVDTPRFDHNPATGESLGLLVEEQKANLLVRSEEFDDASWALLFSALLNANQAAAPNGVLSADQLTISNSSSFSGIRQNYTFLASTTYTFSLWVRAVSGTASFRLKIFDGAADTFSASQSATETWQRYTLTMTTAAGAGAGNVAIANIASPLNQQNIYIWGAQLEAGATATSYIPTVASAVTRAGDVASITGAAFTGFYRQDEGTVFADWNVQTSNAFATVYQFHNNVATVNLIEAYRNNSDTSITARIRESAGTQRTLAFSDQQWAGRVNSVAHAYRANDMEAAINGVESPAPITTVTLPTITALEIGNANGRAAANCLNGPIRRLTYWPQRLPNATLQSITQ